MELPGGEKAGEEFLRTRLLRGISPVLFNNVFALGMEELRRLEDLKKDEISAYVYGAGTGANPRRLAAAAAELEKTADDLYRPRGRTQELNRSLQELDDLDRKYGCWSSSPIAIWNCGTGWRNWNGGGRGCGMIWLRAAGGRNVWAF